MCSSYPETLSQARMTTLTILCLVIASCPWLVNEIGHKHLIFLDIRQTMNSIYFSSVY